MMNYEALYYNFVTSGKSYKEEHNFRVSLDEKTKRNSKLLNDATLSVNSSLLFNNGFFFYSPNPYIGTKLFLNTDTCLILCFDNQ